MKSRTTVRGRAAAIGLALIITVVSWPRAAAAQATFTDISPDYSRRYAVQQGSGGWGEFAAGGRVNKLAAASGSRLVFYAATEWGGLWKSTDGGDTWFELTGHVPKAMWDVAVDPANPNNVYATSFYDGRVNPVSGIQVSHDAGATWVHPLTATPSSASPPGLNCVNGPDLPQPAPGQWSGYGIAIRPDAPQHVFVGTSCGLAITHDSGATWTFVNPFAGPFASGRSHVWDVVVQPGGSQGRGIVDVCGLQGHARSVNGGVTWTRNTLPYPRYTTGRCSIAVSPDEPYVLFITDDITDPVDESVDPYPPNLHHVYESDDAGATWFSLGNPYPALVDTPPVPRATKRLTFVVTNKRSASDGVRRFDLWYGEGGLWRAPCVTPVSPAPAPAPAGTNATTARCPMAQTTDGALLWKGPPHWLHPFLPHYAGQGPILEHIGAHGDSGDLIFDPTMPVDACPLLYASDGGVFINDTSLLNIGGCHNPREFRQPARAPHALWLWGMAGANLANGAVAIHFGAQDDGSWATADARTTPTWHDGPTADSFSRVSGDVNYLWNDQRGLHVADFGSVDGITVWVGNFEEEHLIERRVVNFGWAPKIARFTGGAGQLEFVVVTDAVDIDGNGAIEGLDESAGVFTSNFASGAPFAWTRLGVTPFPDHLCGINSSVDPESGEPVFYLQAGGHCNNWSAGGSRLYRYVGVDPSQHWRRLDDGLIGTPLPGGVGLVAVDRNNANRLYVSNLCGNQCPTLGMTGRMMSSADGGRTWTHASALDDMMTGKGLGPGGSSAFLFANRAGLTDTFRAVFGGYPQPSVVAFDPINPNIIVAGGRDSGLFITTDAGAHWMLLTNPIAPSASRPHIPRPHFVHFDHDPDGMLWLYVGTHGRGVWRIRLALPTANAGGPYHTQEGQNITLSASGSSPSGTPVSFAWDFDNDGEFDDASGPSPVFDRVGRDGLSVVRVRATVGELSAVDVALVSVSNVPPTVAALTANAPKIEHSPVTIAGRIVDPGWQDALRVTIDWGDGTPIEQVDGTQESVRPDASFVFSTYHPYGDNGLFLAIVCRYDDDTHGCEAFTVSITNVAPTAVIEQPQSVMVRGARTVIARSGAPVAVTGRATDPGSDDLTLTWTWHDGTPDTARVSLVNPPGADTYPSPSVQPRDVTDPRSHSYAPCLYDLVFRVSDDDGAAASDSVKLLVTGTSTERAAAGYWQQQYTGERAFTPATLTCYLRIAGFVSSVFDEASNASTIANAYDVLRVGPKPSAQAQFDRQLLTALLNFANGSIGADELVDTNHDHAPDTPFLTVIASVEAIRLNPSSSDAQILAAKDVLEQAGQAGSDL